MPQKTTDHLVDLSDFGESEIAAIEAVATRLNVSFDEACKQMLRQHSREVQGLPRLSPIARLLRFCSVH